MAKIWEHKFLFFVSSFCWDDLVVMLTMQTDNFFSINKTKEVKCLQTLKKKKTQQCLLSLSVSLKTLANNNSSPTFTFSFKKKPQKVGLRTNGKLFFSFCFLICQKKKVLRDKLFFFFVEQKHCEVWTKNKSPSDSEKLKFSYI